jgi:hypothetical protein
VSNPRVWDPNLEDRILYAYGARYFVPGAGQPLPRLNELVTDIDPGQWGGTDWSLLQDGDNYPASMELLPDAVMTFLIPNPNDDPTPPVFQIGLREEPQGTAMTPDPDDEMTLAIGTDRPAEEFDADVNGDGAVGPPDFNILRGQYLLESVDNYSDNYPNGNE